MRHVAPHVWADLAAGRVAPRRAASLESHAGACERCRCQRDRVLSAIDDFDAIAGAEIADLGWDHIGARIYWSGSLERRTAEREAIRPRPRAPWIAAAAAVAVAGVLAAGWWARRPAAVVLWPAAIPERPAPVAAQTFAVELAPAAPLAALPVLARGVVEVDGEPLDWSSPIRAGARLATRDGEVVVQLDGGTGLALEPDTALTFRALDSHQIQIALHAGAVVARVSERRRTEQLAVVSRGRSVVVRGTGFRVRRAGVELEVRCEHGRVEVTDGTTSRSVGPGQRIEVTDADNLADVAGVGPLEPAAIEALRAALDLPLLPSWGGADAALAASSAVAVEADRGAAVAVDGVALGAGDVTVRLAAGRHQIAVAGHPEWGTGKWLTVGAGETRVHAARSAARANRLRLEQARRAMAASGPLDACVSRLDKQGVADGSYAVFDLGINADGTVRFVGVAESNLGLAARSCLLEGAGKIRLPPGPSATLRVRWTY